MAVVFEPDLSEISDPLSGQLLDKTPEDVANKKYHEEEPFEWSDFCPYMKRFPSDFSRNVNVAALRYQLQKNTQISENVEYGELLYVHNPYYTPQTIFYKEVDLQQLNHYIDEIKSVIDNYMNNEDYVKSFHNVVQLLLLFINDDITPFYPLIYPRIIEIISVYFHFIKSLTIQTDYDSIYYIYTRLISSIFQLVPRLYMKIAILPLINEYDQNLYETTINQLLISFRSIGNILHRGYLIIYFLHIIAPFSSIVTIHNISEKLMLEYLENLGEFKEDNYDKLTKNINMTYNDYLYLHSPISRWIIYNYSLIQTTHIFQNLLKIYRESCGKIIVLLEIIRYFDVSYFNLDLIELLSPIKQSDPSAVICKDLFVTLCNKLVEIPPPPEAKIPFLNESFKVLAKVDSLSDYSYCITSFIRLMINHYSCREILIVLKELNNKIELKRIDSVTRRNLESIIQYIIESPTILIPVLSSEYFYSILERCDGTKKQSLCMSLIRRYIDKFSSITLETDPVSLRCIFDLTKFLYDSIDMYNINYTKNISELIISFISRIDFGVNVEQQLNLYIDCRSSYIQLESVQYRLIHLVIRLGYTSIMKLQSNYHRGYNNLKSCLSFAAVTIEGLYDPIFKMRLYHSSIQLSLKYKCLNYIQIFTTFFINTLNSILENPIIVNESSLIHILHSFYHTSILIPTDPDKSPFLITYNIIKFINDYKWLNGTKTQLKLYLELLILLKELNKEEFCYKIKGINSNDDIYLHNKTYSTELFDIQSNIIEKCLVIFPPLLNDKDYFTLLLDTIYTFLYSIEIKTNDIKSIKLLLDNIYKYISFSNIRKENVYFKHILKCIEKRIQSEYDNLTDSVWLEILKQFIASVKAI